MGIKFIKKKKSEVAAANTLADLKTTVDKDGNVCPNADNQVFFTVQGSAKIAGVDNGNQTSMERFKANNRKAFFGKCLVVLQSTSTLGTIQLIAKSVDLKDGMITLTNK